MSQRLSVEIKMPLMIGGLLSFLLVLGVLGGCGGSNDEEDVILPSSPAEANDVTIRVAGSDGTAYTGNYGALTGEPQVVNDTLGGEPVEYEVVLGENVPYEGVSAFFQKAEPGQGELKAEIVGDGEVVAQSSTRAENGSVIVEWLPPQGMIPPEEQELPEEVDLHEEETS